MYSDDTYPMIRQHRSAILSCHRLTLLSHFGRYDFLARFSYNKGRIEETIRFISPGTNPMKARRRIN